MEETVLDTIWRSGSRRYAFGRIGPDAAERMGGPDVDEGIIPYTVNNCDELDS